jgi:NAD(P)-dependent dehydrogenase (short-subunit alcohol dehydrogenase family)
MADLAAQGIETLELDVTNNDSVQKAREAVAELTGGKLDILVNNAYVVFPVIAPIYKFLILLLVGNVRFSVLFAQYSTKASLIQPMLPQPLTMMSREPKLCSTPTYSGL